MNEVFELGGSLVNDAVAHNMMRLLAEGCLWLRTPSLRGCPWRKNFTDHTLLNNTVQLGFRS